MVAGLAARRDNRTPLFQSGSGEGLSELVTEFPAVLRVFSRGRMHTTQTKAARDGCVGALPQRSETHLSSTAQRGRPCKEESHLVPSPLMPMQRDLQMHGFAEADVSMQTRDTNTSRHAILVIINTVQTRGIVKTCGFTRAFVKKR